MQQICSRSSHVVRLYHATLFLELGMLLNHIFEQTFPRGGVRNILSLQAYKFIIPGIHMEALLSFEASALSSGNFIYQDAPAHIY
ncbi:hypothetical protein CEXT_74181 [Caerostris extrusa]|uniref:Uncharacterized protein n=1 Tax=Caerostris extrusa TaxID=172846 RepID=A0AAV4UX37_CAEEX|nr:hypothetical protein CEXT_74181 [Caerostris extrusa]